MMGFDRSHQAALLAAISIGATLGTAAPAHAVYIRADVPVDQYNQIAQLPQYAAAASLRTYTVTPNSDGTSSVSFGRCSGTLISPTKILTAAHCFINKDTGARSTYDTLVVGFSTTVTSDETTPTNVAAVAVMPQYTSGPTKGTAANDVAIVTLSAPVTTIRPALLYAGTATGATAAFVGYGSQGTGTSNDLPGANNRLGGYNVIDVANTSVIQFDFDSPAGNTSSTGAATPLALEASVAGGDSGSALYAKIGDNWFVVGDLFAGGNAIDPKLPNFYGELNSYAPVSNADNAAFIIANAPDAVYERLVGATSPTAMALSDATILGNIQKFGSILSVEDDFSYDYQTLELAALDPSETQIPEPASALLVTAALAALALRHRRTT